MKAFSAPSFSIIKNYVLAWAQTVTGLLVPSPGFMLQWADQLPTSPPVGNREKPFCLQCPEWERLLLMSHNHWHFPLSPYCCTGFFAKYVIILRSLLCLRRSVCSCDILGSLYKFSILKEDDWVKKTCVKASRFCWEMLCMFYDSLWNQVTYRWNTSYYWFKGDLFVFFSSVHFYICSCDLES